MEIARNDLLLLALGRCVTDKTIAKHVNGSLEDERSTDCAEERLAAKWAVTMRRLGLSLSCFHSVPAYGTIAVARVR
jgi:hypothetical protein